MGGVLFLIWGICLLGIPALVLFWISLAISRGDESRRIIWTGLVSITVHVVLSLIVYHFLYSIVFVTGDLQELDRRIAGADLFLASIVLVVYGGQAPYMYQLIANGSR